MSEVKGRCERCGTESPEGSANPSSCPSCPSVTCQTCGGSDDRACACWTDITQMPLADKKALFASCDCEDVGLSVDPTV